MVGRQKWWVDQQQEVVLRKYERETARKGVSTSRMCAYLVSQSEMLLTCLDRWPMRVDETGAGG